MAKIWFLTGNAGKVEEAKHHFAEHGHVVEQLVVEKEIVEPQADSLNEVAEAKIAQALQHLPSKEDMLLVEDAGLFVETLGGFPGVYSSYALKTIGCAGILSLLSNLISEDPVLSGNLRKAEFRAVAALWKDGEILIGEGVCPGRIAEKKSGENGFGFDPIFIPADLDAIGNPIPFESQGENSTHGETFSDIGLEEKKKYSHRSRAIESLLSKL